MEEPARGERPVIHLYQYWVGAERLGLVAHAMHALDAYVILLRLVDIAPIAF